MPPAWICLAAPRTRKGAAENFAAVRLGAFGLGRALGTANDPRVTASSQLSRSVKAPASPTGTVTFLFTDIECSTERWDRNRAGMEEAVQRHDSILRSAIEANGGHVFKTIGDSFCAAFARAEDGVAAALAAQRDLGSEDFSAVDGLRVRMALHAGAADEREGDYFGPPLNRVARLLDIGHGGQVLLSAAAADLVQGLLPKGEGLRDLGQHRLKDLADPEQVHQLLALGLRHKFPALRSLGSLPNNLPPQLTTFIGRGIESAEIEGLLQKHRMVTLFGAGGIGKTRLALQVAAEVIGGFPGGAWFVELAPISDGSLVPNQIAAALGLHESPSSPMIETVIAHLKGKALLLIVDNCEHIIAQAANAVDEILRGCPHVAIIATSREALNIAGEQTYRTPSLGVPAGSVQTLRASEALTYASIAFFVERAQAADARFTLSDANAPIVADICRRLDGIALAIELAAARVKVFPVKVIDEKLDDRFRVLTHGGRTNLERHQTLRALIDWSYNLLTERERTIFRRLAIFAGGFTLDLATVVCGDESIADFEIIDLLASLVEKSLVQGDVTGMEPRYRLLESTRLYACERLAEHGEHAAVARAHATACLDLAQRLEVASETMSDREWDVLAEPELDNWRAALEWSFSPHGDVLTGQRLGAALSVAWSRMTAVEGRRWVRVGLNAAGEQTPSAVVARLELTDAKLAYYLLLWREMLASARRALRLFARSKDERGIAAARIVAGRALALLGRVKQSETLLKAAFSTCRSLGDRRSTGVAIECLALARMLAGDVSGSRPLYMEAMSIFESIGAQRSMGIVAGNLAEAELRNGDAAAALRSVARALAAFRAANDARGIALTLCNMSAYSIALGRWNNARDSARKGLALSRERHMQISLTGALEHLASIAARRPAKNVERRSRDCRRAARIMGFVDARLAALGKSRDFAEAREHSVTLDALSAVLITTELTDLFAEGSVWGEERAVTEALAV